MTYLSDFSWVSFLTGGLAGALLTTFATWRRGLNERSLQILEQYFARFDDIERVYELLSHPSSLDSTKNLNCVLLVGDWMDIVAMLYIKRLANRAVLRESGLIRLVNEFRVRLGNYGGPVATKVLSKWEFSQRLEGPPHGNPCTRAISKLWEKKCE